MKPLARRSPTRHISVMATRSCKPDADFKKLWQTLMPGTPMPACGASEDKSAKAAEKTATDSDAAAPKQPRD